MTDTPAYPPAPQASAAGAPAPVPGKTLGIVALVVAFFFNLIGLILGIVALVQSRKVGARNLPAVWAIIVGSISIVLAIIGFIIFFSVLGSALAMCADLGPGVHEVNGVTITCN